MSTKLIVRVLEIECLHKSAEMDKMDEIYCFMQVFSASAKSGRPVLGEKTAVKGSQMQKVKKGSLWQPNPAEYSFDLGSNEAFGLSFSIGEGDNKKLYLDVHNGNLNAEFGNFKWGEITKELVSDAPALVNTFSNFSKLTANATSQPNNLMGLGMQLVGLFRKIIEGARKDDVLGNLDLLQVVGNGIPATRYPFDFKRAVAHYRGMIEIEVKVSDAAKPNVEAEEVLS